MTTPKSEVRVKKQDHWKIIDQIEQKAKRYMPTLPQKLEAIRAVCVKNDESILDLKFGCKIKITRRMDCEYAILYPEECWRVGDDVWTMCNLGARNDRKENYEIIGRDLLLSDVLGAIERRHKNGSEYGNIEFWFSEKEEHDGLLAFYAPTRSKILCWWNLLRPSLEDQEEATISLIYEILCSTSQK